MLPRCRLPSMSQDNQSIPRNGEVHMICIDMHMDEGSPQVPELSAFHVGSLRYQDRHAAALRFS
jgi:hypothetical protein